MLEAVIGKHGRGSDEILDLTQKRHETVKKICDLKQASSMLTSLLIAGR